MKIALLAPYPPFPPQGGGQQRMYQIIRYLASRHTIHLVTFSVDDHATAELDALRSLCTVTTVPTPVRTPLQRLRTTLASGWPDMLWRGYSPAFAAVLHEILEREHYNIVQAESIEMTQYAELRQTHPGARAPLWVYDAWNVEYTIQRRAFLTDLARPRYAARAGYSLLQWIKLRRYEQRLHRLFAGTFVVSEGDRALLQHIDPRLMTVVVPNGVDTEYFSPQRATAGTPTALFTGTLDYRPNVDAILWFVAAVWPRIRSAAPSARLHIVGRNPGPAVLALASEPGIAVFANVADVRPFFNAASVYVVPMRIGGGVRLKVLEAFAQRVPVVATSLGVAGIAGFQPAIHAMIADEPEDFARAVLQLFANDQQVNALTSTARALVLQRYAWSTILQQMENGWHAWRSDRASTITD